MNYNMYNKEKYCCENKCYSLNDEYKRKCILHNYCCNKKCFDTSIITHVDGRACDKCMSFGYCICNCKTYVYKKNNNIR